MEDLLREFLELALSELRDARVPNQLRGRKPKRKSSDSDKEEKKIEMSTVAGSLGAGGGYTAPLGASSADMQIGDRPVAGKKVKKRKKDYVRIK